MAIAIKAYLLILAILDISVPRDRESDFEPQIVSKRVTKINGLDQKIIYLYAKSISTTDIQQQLFELYETEISTSFISDVIEAIYRGC